MCRCQFIAGNIWVAVRSKSASILPNTDPNYRIIGGDFDGVPTLPTGLEDVSTYPALFAELLKRGYSEDELEKIAGRNMLRVLRGVEKNAARLREEREPSEVVFED